MRSRWWNSASDVKRAASSERRIAIRPFSLSPPFWWRKATGAVAVLATGALVLDASLVGAFDANALALRPITLEAFSIERPRLTTDYERARPVVVVLAAPARLCALNRS